METLEKGNREKVDVMARIYEQARSAEARIILAEPDDERVVKAQEIIEREGLVKELILLDSEYWNRLPEHEKDELVQMFQTARAKESLSDEQVREQLASDTKLLSAVMVKAGKAEGYVAGNKCKTSDTIRPALKIFETEHGFASSFFLMLFKGSPLFFADCGFNVAPTPEQLARIGIDTAHSAQKLGIVPRVAFLSFATHGSADHSDVDAVREAVRLAREQAPDIEIDGPLQFDAAFDSAVGKAKAPNSSVAGVANVLVFPDLNSGNLAYKIAERMGGCQAVGPLMQDFKFPVNDLSRGCSVQDIVDVVAYTAMQSRR